MPQLLLLVLYCQLRLQATSEPLCVNAAVCPAWDEFLNTGRGIPEVQLQLLPPPSPLEAANISQISASHPRSFDSGNSAMPSGNSLGYKFMIHGAFGTQVMKHNERMENTNCARTIPAFHTGKEHPCILWHSLKLLPREKKYPSTDNLQHSSPEYPF